MARIEKYNGQYYLSKVTRRGKKLCRSKVKLTDLIFFPTYKGGSLALAFRRISVPKELEGKKLMFKVEVIDKLKEAKNETDSKGNSI